MTKSVDQKVEKFQQLMLEFWETDGRKDLPWRSTRDPWKILLVEILLKKTTAEQVKNHFPIISRWTPEIIIAMETNVLEEHLKPLGLYQQRAKDLKQIANGIIDLEPEELNSDKLLRSFRGIGRYTSNSLRCIVFGVPVPALDTNMIRVIQRVFSWVSDRTRPREDRKLWEFAETLVPLEKCREYNWAVLDFGALICTHRNPSCDACPLNHICDYYQEIMS